MEKENHMYDLYIPDGLPELSRGGHPDHTEGKACIMELVSFLSQDEWSDNPATVHLSETVNKKKRELHLCERCAR